MQFNGWTFVLEIINFLVLVWLLHRLLYRPVLAVIARRRAEIDRQLSEADAARQQAEKLKAEYDQRLEGATQERAVARHALDEDMDRERGRQMALLQQDLVAERERAATLALRQAQQLRHEADVQALALASRFASRLLGALAGPALEASLIDLTLTECGHLPAERRQALRDGLRQLQGAVQVSSVYPLDTQRRAAVGAALAALSDVPLPPIRFVQDPALLAGLRVQAGAWRLGANLLDELQAFTEMVQPDA